MGAEAVTALALNASFLTFLLNVFSIMCRVRMRKKALVVC